MMMTPTGMMRLGTWMHAAVLGGTSRSHATASTEGMLSQQSEPAAMLLEGSAPEVVSLPVPALSSGCFGCCWQCGLQIKCILLDIRCLAVQSGDCRTSSCQCAASHGLSPTHFVLLARTQKIVTPLSRACCIFLHSAPSKHDPYPQ